MLLQHVQLQVVHACLHLVNYLKKIIVLDVGNFLPKFYNDII